jgi:hypothetical protein
VTDDDDASSGVSRRWMTRALGTTLVASGCRPRHTKPSVSDERRTWTQSKITSADGVELFAERRAATPKKLLF